MPSVFDALIHERLTVLPLTVAATFVGTPGTPANAGCVVVVVVGCVVVVVVGCAVVVVVGGLVVVVVVGGLVVVVVDGGVVVVVVVVVGSTLSNESMVPSAEEPPRCDRP